VRGFSLIEILVVIVIVAVTAAAVTLSLAGAGGERQLERDAARVRALLAHVCEQAELGGRDIGVSFDRAGYRFSRSEHSDWLVLRDGDMRPRKWSVNADATLTRADTRVSIGAEFPAKPQLVCFASGELTAFRLELALPDGTLRLRFDGAASGSLSEIVHDQKH